MAISKVIPERKNKLEHNDMDTIAQYEIFIKFLMQYFLSTNTASIDSYKHT